MLKKLLTYPVISLSIFIAFLLIFSAFSYWKIYSNTLGKISHNYERVGDWNNYQIHPVKKPYEKISNQNLLQWDADIYKCISERLYEEEDKCYGRVRGAFFPLFPLIWKLFYLNPIAISILNYILFSFSIFILFKLYFKEKLEHNKLLYAVLLSFPAAVFYFIPYSEALFLFTTCLAICADAKKKKALYFIAALLLAMVRPATVFVMLAISFTELIKCFVVKDIKTGFSSMFLKLIPFFIGYLVVYIIQYISSGNPFLFWEARKFWVPDLVTEFKISDWSTEGFGMSVFALVIVIPLSMYLFFKKMNKIRIQEGRFFMDIRNYWSMVSIFYLLGIFLFTMLTSNGNLHSFSRFVLGSPFFFILILDSLKNREKQTWVKYFISFIILVVGVAVFLNKVEYGGDRFQFAYLGLYLLMLFITYIIIKPNLSLKIEFLIGLILIIASLIWNSYLFNMFLSNAWVYT